MPLEVEYLGTKRTWDAYTRSELCSRTGCVEVVVHEWVAGKHKLSAAWILALVLGMPALELLGFVALSGVAPCSYHSALPRGSAHHLLLCSTQLQCSALQHSLDRMPCQKALSILALLFLDAITCFHDHVPARSCFALPPT